MNSMFAPNRAPESESSGGIGGDWGGVRPRPEDPMSWSLPMARIGGADLRIHALFLLFILVQLARAVIADSDPDSHGPIGVAWTAVWLIFLWWIVLLHELGHAAINRLLGFGASEILMWPLGGLARARSVGGWRAQLLRALGGPVVNVIIFLVLAPILYTQTQSFAVAFPLPLLDSEQLAPAIVLTAESWLLTALFIVQWANAIVLAFNILPIFPFDGAHVLHAILWRSVGIVRATRIISRISIAGSVLMGVLAILLATGINSAYIIAIAFFCGFVGAGSLRKLEFTEEALEELDHVERVEFTDSERESGVVGRIHGSVPGKGNPKIDRILDKIRTKGMKSLSLRERWSLRRATRRRREDS